ncbi:hypothetical protein [Aureispira anguillae]|uniref:Uncharacterized protein n=1 Tax=Aureispira anguillae TaxID=2864201 RepID=A0A915YH37_9BACT|nr:hypothetical protein [Aureispira anguillae]BDS13055.1 hypothetical protein AsAng_0037830 [Aureispira anguillae]
MSLGTISEKRAELKASTATTIATPSTTTVLPTKETPSKVATPVVEVVKEQPPLKEVKITLDTTKVPSKEGSPKHIQDTSCTYCKVDSISILAIRFSVVLVLLAFCYKLIKTAKNELKG